MLNARRVKGSQRGRRGLSGLGLLIVIAGLLALAVAYAVVPPVVYRLWPLVIVALGVFGLLRRPGWVSELDFHLGPEFGRAADRPRRVFSLVLIVAGLLLLTVTLHVVDERIVGPVVLIALGLLLVWRRAR